MRRSRLLTTARTSSSLRTASVRATWLSGSDASPAVHACLLVSEGSCARAWLRHAFSVRQLRETVPGASPVASCASRQLRSSRIVSSPTGPRQQDRRELLADAIDLGDSSAADDEIAAVLLERLLDRDRLAGIARLAAYELTRPDLCRPEVQHVAGGILEVVGYGKALRPGTAFAVGSSHEPEPGTRLRL